MVNIGNIPLDELEKIDESLHKVMYKHTNEFINKMMDEYKKKFIKDKKSFNFFLF